MKSGWKLSLWSFTLWKLILSKAFFSFWLCFHEFEHLSCNLSFLLMRSILDHESFTVSSFRALESNCMEKITLQSSTYRQYCIVLGSKSQSLQVRWPQNNSKTILLCTWNLSFIFEIYKDFSFGTERTKLNSLDFFLWVLSIPLLSSHHCGVVMTLKQTTR